MSTIPAELIGLAQRFAASKLADARWSQRIKTIPALASRPADPAAVGFERLKALLGHVCRTVPFYSRIPLEAVTPSTAQNLLSLFPIVTNVLLRDNLQEFVSTDYDPGQIDVTHSSGSTGRPTPHIKSLNDEYVINLALRSRLAKDLGLSINHEILDLSPRQPNSNGVPAEPLVTLDLDAGKHLAWRLRRFDASNSASVEEYCRFASRPAELLYGAPSRIRGLVDYCRHSGWRLRFKAIASTFEELHPAARKEYEAFFHCRVTNLYGTNETGFVGWECREGAKMHVEEDFAYVEVLDVHSDKPTPPGELGRLIITSMKSWQMPIVRYDTGDLGALTEERCLCGSTTQLIGRLEGRTSVTFICTDGSPIAPGRITSVLKRRDIPQFQVVQRTPGEIGINLGPDQTPKELTRLQGELAPEWRDLRDRLRVRLVSEPFHYAPSGKLNVCVSLMKRPF